MRDPVFCFNISSRPCIPVSSHDPLIRDPGQQSGVASAVRGRTQGTLLRGITHGTLLRDYARLSQGAYNNVCGFTLSHESLLRTCFGNVSPVALQRKRLRYSVITPHKKGFRNVSRVCHEGVTRVFQGHFKGVSRAFQERFKGVSKKL